MSRKPSGLRVIRTARSKAKINDAVKAGFWPLVKPVETNPPFKSRFAVYQHPDTGEVRAWGNPRYRLEDEGWEQVIPWKSYRLPRFKEPFAAYLIPKDIQVGERVWLVDLIEDFQGVSGVIESRLNAASAVWTGKDFEIDYDSERDCGFTIG